MLQPDYDDALTGPFWRAAREQQLVISWCDACDQAVWYPQHDCPACRRGLSWKPLSGRATLLSWSVVRMPLNPTFKTPYIPALVVPEEAPGARLVTQLVDCEPEALRCDMALQVCFRSLEPKGAEPFVAPVFLPT
ncbi:Zn-ribbon domain-containing OB-fold protein [Haliea atlantica]